MSVTFFITLRNSVKSFPLKSSLKTIERLFETVGACLENSAQAIFLIPVKLTLLILSIAIIKPVKKIFACDIIILQNLIIGEKDYGRNKRGIFKTG